MPGNTENTPEEHNNTDQPMQEALGRQLPPDPAIEADDPTIGAMAENRRGAHATPVDADPQVRAMSNEFELEDETQGDEMTKALSERRTEAKHE